MFIKSNWTTWDLFKDLWTIVFLCYNINCNGARIFVVDFFVSELYAWKKLQLILNLIEMYSCSFSSQVHRMIRAVMMIGRADPGGTVNPYIPATLPTRAKCLRKRVQLDLTQCELSLIRSCGCWEFFPTYSLFSGSTSEMKFPWRLIWPRIHVKYLDLLLEMWMF